MKITIEEFIKSPVELVNKISNKKLTEFIMLFADNYYNNTNPNIDISDEVFDKLVEILRIRDPKSKYFTSIGAPIINDKVKLPFPMFSLNKVKPDNIDKWVVNHKGPYSLSDKLDGMSAMLYNGHLYKRGQGLDGQDIGYLLKHINIGDVNLDDIRDVAIRGELIISKENFKVINKDGVFKNARNAISGIVNCKNPDKEIIKYVDFVAYNVVSPIIKQEDQYLYLESKGFNVVNYCNVDNINVDGLVELTNKRKNEGKYEIDGIVIIDNVMSYDIRSGNKESVNQNPSYSVAFKFLNEDNIIECVVENVEWNISRYNYLKPKVKIAPVYLMGSVINYATAHNAKFIVDNKIGKGSIINITKSGEIIPKIISVVKGSNPEMPTVKYHWNKNNVDIIIDNETEDKQKQKLLFELKSNNIKFFNQKAADKLVDNGIYDICSIIGEDQLIIRLFGKVMGAKMIKSLKDNLMLSGIEELMVGSGIFGRGIGIKKLMLANKIDIRDWDEGRLIEIKGLGKENVKLLVDGKEMFIKYYSALKNKCELNGIKIAELNKDCNNENISEDNKDNINDSNINESINNQKLLNMKIVFTGFRNKELENEIIKNGGLIVNSVSGKTNILIVDKLESNSSKINKAKQLKVDIVTEEQFRKKYLE